MITLKELIKLAEVYGENSEVYMELDNGDIEEICGVTLTDTVNKHTNNGETGLVLRLPLKI